MDTACLRGHDVDTLIDAFLDETKDLSVWSLRPKDHVSGRAILNADSHALVAVLLRLCERMRVNQGFRCTNRIDVLASSLLARPLPFTAGDVECLMAAFLPESENDLHYGFAQWDDVVDVTRRYLDSGGTLTSSMEAMLRRAYAGAAVYRSGEISKIRAMIGNLLGDWDAHLPDPGEEWANAVRADVSTLPVEERNAWGALFAHAATAEGGKPKAKWLAAAEERRQSVGTAGFEGNLVTWMRLVKVPQLLKEPSPVFENFVRDRVDYVQANQEFRAALYEYQNRHSISEKNIAVLKGLAWYASSSASSQVGQALAHLADMAFSKVPERGTWATTAGNAAIWALGRIPGGVGVASLARLRTRLRDRGALKLIAAAIETAASNSGMTVDELEDLAVPTGGLDADGTRRETFGEDGAATLTLDAKTAKTNLQWFGPDGKPRKAVPAAIKKNYPAEVKALKAAEEEIKQALVAQAARFDTFLLDEREWPLSIWQERYLAHPILGNLARRLIWVVNGVPTLPDDTPTQNRQNEPAPPAQPHSPAMIVPSPISMGDSPGRQPSGSASAGLGCRSRGGGLPAVAPPICQNEPAPADLPHPPAAGGPCERSEQGGGSLRLWHPLHATAGDVLHWRERLESRGIVQPFKQAHREIYLLTDAEQNTRTYSNRFAAHILKQHQFNSLCALRGWKNQLRLMVDSEYPPATRELPQHNLRAEFWVEGIGDDYGVDTNETGTYLRLTTDQVRFYRLDAATNYAHAGGGGYGRRYQAPADSLPLDEIPRLVFSEVMRDVDLFVGVASVGNDPTWADGGPQGRFRNYWQDYAFGDLTETAKTRADVLARLLPRLKIVARCRLDGRFLIVRGDLRTYKIHLGSGNILMEPNDQYLCIVPSSRADDGQDLFLPFEGDRTLAVILSKAVLLAADTHIADPSITRQIQVK